MNLHVKRLDLLHPEAPGNKYFKLKYNLLKAQEKTAERIVTVGGAYSNHLHAVAASCRQAALPCTGIVRGERPPQLSLTLHECEQMGMELEFMPRSAYDEHPTEAFRNAVHMRYPRSYFIPEGGSNYLGIQGCTEILEANDRLFDTLAVPVGSGATLAGIILLAAPTQRILAFPALDDRSLPERVEQQLYWSLMDESLARDLNGRIEWIWDYTFGGFARVTDELLAFMASQEAEGLPLDRVYTSKMMYGLHDMAERGKIGDGERVLAIHTGGLQGNRGLA